MQKIQEIIPISMTDLENFDLVDDYNSRDGHLDDGFDCAICKNRGHTWHYYDDGSNDYYMKECECTNRRRFVRKMKTKNLEELLNYKVSAFIAEKDWQKQLKNVAISYVKDDARDWMCLIGQSGCGKTHLASAVVVTLAEKNLNIEYMMWSSFIEATKPKPFDNYDDTLDQLIETYKNTEVLYIDDLFKSNNTDRVVTLAFDLINHRYVNRLTTIITSELSIGEMAKLDEAIAGRIRQMSKQYFAYVAKDGDKNYRMK